MSAQTYEWHCNECGGTTLLGPAGGVFNDSHTCARCPDDQIHVHVLEGDERRYIGTMAAYCA